MSRLEGHRPYPVAILLLRLAWRNLWRNRRRTLVMLSAVVLGVWAMVLMNALMRGMTEQMVRNGLNQLPGEAQIHHPDYRRDPAVRHSLPMPSDALREQLLAHPQISALSARVRVPAVLASARELRGVLLLGVDPAAEAGAEVLPGELVAGRALRDVSEAGLLLGERLRERLQVQPGERLVLSAENAAGELVERGIVVVGVYRSRVRAIEETQVYMGRAPAQEWLGMQGQVSELVVRTRDYRHPERWMPALLDAAGGALEAVPWSTLDPFMASMLEVQDGFALIFIAVVFVLLSFGLANTLLMAIFERVREIALMQALGMARALILWQILLENLFLLLLGLAFGIGLGLLSVFVLADGLDLSGVAEGMALMGVGAVLQPALHAGDVLLTVVVVLLLGTLTGLLPAWRASRLQPARALG